jgi:hypothetical protein
VVVNDLAGQIAMTAKDAEARTIGRATNAFADPEAATLALTAEVFAFVHN